MADGLLSISSAKRVVDMALVLPAASVVRMPMLCVPSANSPVTNGLAQAENAPMSREQVAVPLESEVKAIDLLVKLVSDEFDENAGAFGGLVSMVKV
jgi:hypothetical protein